jgi:hypothetical protein
MTYINWDKTFEFGSLKLPTYGNYGGGSYSEGSFDKEPKIDLLGSDPYLSSDELRDYNPAVGDSVEAVDALDYLFYQHDVDSMLAATDAQQNLADAKLLASVVALQPETFDPSGEASLYAGFTTFAMLEQLAFRDGLTTVSPRLLLGAVTDAVKDIEYGLSHLEDSELLTALSTVFDFDDNGTAKTKDDVFYLNFKVTTNGSFAQESAEFLAMNALNQALDGGERGNERFLQTGGSDSWYHLTFNVATQDLDIHSGHYML